MRINSTQEQKEYFLIKCILYRPVEVDGVNDIAAILCSSGYDYNSMNHFNLAHLRIIIF